MAFQIQTVFQGKGIDLENKLLQQKTCKLLGFLKYGQRLYLSEITIQLNEKLELLLIKDGEILKIQKYIASNSIENINQNFEQLKRLFWVGKTNCQGQKIGKWNAVWRGEKLKVGGYYNDEGEKSGNWIELFENYWDKAQVTYEGVYDNGKKKGQWTIFQKDIEIGGGMYNIEGEKTGVWIEAFENYSSWCKLRQIGKYQNGKKVGEWTQIYRNKIIGFGTYNDNQIKVGNWVDLYENFFDWGQITYKGKYSKGIKIGNWQTFQEDKKIGGGNYKEGGVKDGEWIEISNRNHEITYIGQYKNGKGYKQLYISHKNDIIGGGTYNDNGMKNGKWVELQDNYYDFGKVIYEGMYNNEKKIGKWQGIYNKNPICQGEYSFDTKIGIWTELHEHFQNGCQVKYKGEYKNGKKFKKWDTIYQYDIIGGGFYDENELKNGKWIILDENFDNLCKVIWSGQFKNGKKIGRWEIIYKDKIIGGGTYDQNGIQQGQWIELHPIFWDQQMITYNGVYWNGIKVGYWQMNQQNIKIGGGFYDDNGMKQGKWIELAEKFLQANLYVIGEYIDSKKYGKWEANLNMKLIGYGFYGNGYKNGNWIDINDPYLNTLLSYIGKYDNGKKKGNWDTFYNYNKIGGGLYGENGLKNGKWIEIDGNVNIRNKEQNIKEMEYQNDVMKQ
ncbi:unnamed protein product [Paramecium sonneborni]|uniref:Uncharacterized protein n=1 Tax=Paramecium sonneborni TaxID=65129 RepID=A0A8S1R6Z9_9CILI|nr:unnamed protein product [Paramecium sonneborni]